MNGEIDGLSLDVKAEKLDQLKEIFPEFFSEGKLDFAAVKEVLGDDQLASPGHFELSWAGKGDARREIQKRTSATLVPDKAGSINFDTAENIFIEGENLEVLRTLQRSYFGKVKMIYIDPPYNTGNDSFIYPDDFAERKEEYLKRTGQTNGDGYLNKLDLFRKNSKENGQYHSVWLSMMSPRLYLARNLLRQDGVIFVSIDDNEQPNLKLLLDEIFGAENFIAQMVWSAGRKNDSTFISVSHEYILCYAKSLSTLKEKSVTWRKRKEGLDSIYKQFEKIRKTHKTDYEAATAALKEWYKNLPDSDPAKRQSHYSWVDERGIYFPDNISWPGGGGPDYEVLHPKTKKPCAVPSRGWIYSDPAKMQEVIRDNRVHFGPDETYVPCLKSYLADREYEVPYSVFYQDGRASTKRLRQLLGGDYFDHPKDEYVIQDLIEIATDKDDLVMDFFAGSGTTAHAVMNMNRKDGGNRKFLLVQMPEPTEEGSAAFKAGYKTIADLCKARVTKVIEAFENGNNGKMDFAKSEQKLGFRAYKIQVSNFKQWKSEISDKDELLKQLEEFKEPLFKRPDDSFDLLNELILKSGLTLATKTERRETSDEVPYYIVGDELIYALEGISPELLKDVEAIKPRRFVVLGNLFTGEKADETMTNWRLQLEENGIEFTLI
ncbi:MAG: site-specific DNA-methyltransferase [Acidobacteria bacterium]|nr:site-specific DNA-methyltransferase [Acidobacteriota bacterium]